MYNPLPMIQKRLNIGFLQILFGFSVFVFPLSALAANPTVSAFSPADDTAGVSRDTNLVITFDQTVIASGSTLATPSRIRIFNATTGTVAEDITASGSQVTVSSAVVTINPSITLAKSTTYYVQIEAKAFVNASNEAFAAIADSTTWNFTIIGGGAANRQLRAKLLANMPKHYNKERPCLADVGIFSPTDTCRSTKEEIEEVENTSSEVPTKVYKAAPVPVVRTVSPELEEERRKRNERLLQAVQSPVKQAAQEFVSNLHERVCGRVENRFSGNAIMIERINTRLEKRFGFSCDL